MYSGRMGNCLGKIDPNACIYFTQICSENIWSLGKRSIKHQNINSNRAADLSDNLLGFNERKPLLHLTLCSSSTVIFCARNGVIFYLLEPDLFIFSHQVVSHPRAVSSTSKISKACDSVSSS